MLLKDNDTAEDFEELIKEIEEKQEDIKKYEREVKRLNKNPFALFG